MPAVLDLGEMYVCGFTDKPEPTAPKAPLEVIICSQCGLVQLRHTCDPESLYRTYWYRSGVNQSMRQALCTIAAASQSCVGDAALDIGCNDGTLLSFSPPNTYRVGFEPATALAQDAEAHADWIIPNFFSAEVLGEAKFKVITSIACFYDIDDPNAFVADIKKVLAPDGVWVVEMQYLVDVLRQNAFDFFVHEHLCCYSLTSLKHLLDRHGLVIVDCVQTDTNGGSFRCYVKHSVGWEWYPDLGPLPQSLDSQSSQRVRAMLARERHLRIRGPETYAAFANRIAKIKNVVCRYATDCDGREEKVYLCGASTKGNTLVQYFGLAEHVVAAGERNPEKHGKWTAGTEIPIVSEEEMRENADLLIVLPWHFKKEILEREKEFLNDGGRLLFPLPKPTVVTKDGEEVLA